MQFWGSQLTAVLGVTVDNTEVDFLSECLTTTKITPIFIWSWVPHQL